MLSIWKIKDQQETDCKRVVRFLQKQIGLNWGVIIPYRQNNVDKKPIRKIKYQSETVFKRLRTTHDYLMVDLCMYDSSLPVQANPSK